MLERFQKYWIIFLAVTFLSGCANLGNLNKGAYLGPQTEPTIQPFKLSAVKVVWIDDSNLMQLRVNKMVNLRYGETITESDKRKAAIETMKLITVFNQNIQERMRSQLELNNVREGNEIILELTPIKASYEITMLDDLENHPQLSIKASLRKNDANQSLLWSFLVYTNWLHNREDMFVVDGTVEMVIQQLRKSGWIEGPVQKTVAQSADSLKAPAGSRTK